MLKRHNSFVTMKLLQVNLIAIATLVSLSGSTAQEVIQRIPQTALHNASLRILNGVDIQKSSVPWLVQLIIEQRSSSARSCDGTIIASYWLLTAADCLKDIAYVTIVSNQLPDIVLAHGFFTDSKLRNYNVALIRTSPVRFANPLQIAPANYAYGLVDNYVALGWKLTSNGHITDSPLYSTVSLKSKLCTADNLFTGHSLLCGATSICQADIGSPLLSADFRQLVGVAVMAPTNCSQGLFDKSYFVKITAVRDWITEQTRV